MLRWLLHAWSGADRHACVISEYANRAVLCTQLVLAAICVAVTVGCRNGDARAPIEPYARDAAGQSAVIDAAITLSWPHGESAGLIVNAELCGKQAYLFSPSVESIQVADLSTQRVDRRIGRAGNGPSDLRRPIAIAVDCSGDKVYVVEGPGGILSFDRQTGNYVETFAHPTEFRASLSSRSFLVARGNRIVVPGLWPRERGALDRHGRAAMYADTRLGLMLDVSTRVSMPTTVSIEEGCNANYSACFRVDIAALTSGSWVVAQGGGTRIGVLSAADDLIRTIDIRSPQFMRDGTVAGTSTEDQMNWGETNSTIRGVYTVRDVIAVVHAKHATKNWRRGQVVQFDVYMNLFTVTGERLVSDIRLPDLPVGQDDEQYPCH